MSKIRDLIEVVRPAGCGVQLIAAEIINTVDGIEISDYLDPEIYAYDFTRYTVGREDKIAFVGPKTQATTMLFKILAGEEEPDEGDYKWGVTTSQGYF